MLHSQFFVVASLPSAHVCFGCRRPWPLHEDISQPIALWQTKSLCDIMLLGCPCLLTLAAHGNEKIQPVNSGSLEIPALSEFFYRLLQRYHVLNRSCWLSCLWSRRGQKRTHSIPLSQASNPCIPVLGPEPLPEDVTFYRNLPCTECLMAQTNLFPVMHSAQVCNPLILLSYFFLFHPGFCS